MDVGKIKEEYMSFIYLKSVNLSNLNKKIEVSDFIIKKLRQTFLIGILIIKL